MASSFLSTLEGTSQVYGEHLRLPTATCSHCKGSGSIRTLSNKCIKCGGDGINYGEKPCEFCCASGKVKHYPIQEPCFHCNGLGKKLKSSSNCVIL